MGVCASTPYVPSPDYKPVTHGDGVNNLRVYIKQKETNAIIQEMHQSSTCNFMNSMDCYCKTEEPVCNPLKPPTGKLIPHHQWVRGFDSTDLGGDSSGGVVGSVNRRPRSTTRTTSSTRRQQGLTCCEGIIHPFQVASHTTKQRVEPIVFPPSEFETFPMDDAPPDVALRVFTAQREERLDRGTQ